MPGAGERQGSSWSVSECWANFWGVFHARNGGLNGCWKPDGLRREGENPPPRPGRLPPRPPHLFVLFSQMQFFFVSILLAIALLDGASQNNTAMSFYERACWLLAVGVRDSKRRGFRP